jgi:hypothetical protein
MNIPQRGGWFNLRCWNGLSNAQKLRLIADGNLPFGYTPEGPCPNGAEIAIETRFDPAPGPRFYCVECGLAYVARFREERT